MDHIFISYSRHNKAYARQVANHLMAKGFDVWIDDRIDAGVDWQQAIEDAIEACGALIVIMSPASKESDWVQIEVTFAKKRRKPVLPLLLEGECWFQFVTTNYLDVRDEALPSDEFLEDLARYAHKRSERGSNVITEGQGISPVRSATGELPAPRRRAATRLPFVMALGLTAFIVVVLLLASQNTPRPPIATPTLDQRLIVAQSSSTPEPIQPSIITDESSPPPSATLTDTLPTATFTEVPPTATLTDILPTAVPPTATFTEVPPTATLTQVPPTPSEEPERAPGSPILGRIFAEQAVNLRAAPGTSAALITALPPQTRLEILGSNAAGDWLYVRTPDGTEGWVFGALVLIDGRSYNEPTPMLNVFTAMPPTPSSGGRGQLVFNSQRDANGEIYVMDTFGTSLTRLTTHVGDDNYPTYSPDGSRILFYSNRESDYDIYVMNPDGSNIINLTPNDNNANDLAPCWSPDGTQIAFLSYRTGTAEIYIMNADGSDPRNLTNNDTDDYYPAWSPRGDQIAFTSGLQGNYDLYVIDVSGANLRQLTTDPASDARPAWSPDGTQIAFVSARDGDWDIYVMSADGTTLNNLTRNAVEDDAPAWSPDGRQIAFTSTRDGNVEIYVMNADGTDVRRITHHGADERFPAWRP